MSSNEVETRTLEDVSFEAFCTAKLALERQIEDDEDALAELVEKWNAANAGNDDE